MTAGNAPGGRQSRARRTVLRLLRPAALVVVLAFAAVFVVSEWDDLVSAVGRLHWALVMGSFGLALVSVLTSAAAWRALLGGLGSRLPVLAAGRVFFLGQLGKYVPGGIWPIVAQAELSKEYGVPRTRSGSTSLVHMLVTLVVGVVVAAVPLTFSSAVVLDQYWWIALIGLGGAGLLTPPAFNMLLRAAFRIVRRPPPEPVAARDLMVACLWVAVTWLAVGAHMWLLARALAPAEPRLFLLATGGFALAWVVGFLLVFLPAGAGAREATLALVLSPVMTTADAVALALVSRVLLLLCDFAAAGVAVVAERRRHGKDGVPRITTDASVE